MHRRTLGTLATVVIAAACTSTLNAQAGTPRILLPTTRIAPDEYGVQDYTVTTIGASSFTPISDSADESALYQTNTPDNSTIGFFRYGEAGGITASLHFLASVDVPAGAVIDFIGLECASDMGPDGVEVQMYLVDRYDNVTPIAGFQSTEHLFDTDYNSTAIGFQLTRNVHNQLILDVETHDGEFGWVEIWWKRTVSPPPASPDFADVPTTDQGYQYIEALFASRITGGCGGGNYCPDANLTRRQMAVFLAKALGLHWPY